MRSSDIGKTSNDKYEVLMLINQTADLYRLASKKEHSYRVRKRFATG